MKRKFFIICSIMLAVLLCACGKKDEEKTEGDIVIVDPAEEGTESNIPVEKNTDTDTCSDEDYPQIPDDIVLVDSNEVFGKWATPDKSVILDISSDEMNLDEIQGNSYLLLSKDKSEFKIFKLESDKLVTDGVDEHMFYITNLQLHIYFDNVEYIMDRITDQEYEQFYNEIVNAEPDKLKELDIPEEEILNTSELDGLWVDVNRRAMLLTEGSYSSYITYKKSVSGEYKIGGPDGSTPNLLWINDNNQFAMNFSNGHLLLTNVNTGETIEMEKLKRVEYDELRSKIYYGRDE